MANQWYSAVESTPEQYVPLPLQQIVQGLETVQNRHEENLANLDALDTGIASINAMLPGHKEYVKNLQNNYRTESENLLKKYNYNASDPEFRRDFSRLKNKYTQDQNLSTISTANAMYAEKYKSLNSIREKGDKYIDTNPNPTGIDKDGNLIADVGSVRATHFDKDINKIFTDTKNALINDNQGTITNSMAVDMALKSLLNEGVSNPAIRDAVQYYMAQGATAEQAQEAVSNLLQREAASALKIERDAGYYSHLVALDNNRRGWAQFGLNQQEFAYKVAKDMAEQNRASMIIPKSSPIDTKDVNKGLIETTDFFISNLDKNGVLKDRTIKLLDTEENRAKFPNHKVKYVGPNDRKHIEVELGGKDDPDFNNFIGTIKSELGDLIPPNASEKQILEKYKEYLQLDNNSPTFWASPIKEHNDGITQAFFGKNGENLSPDAIIRDGKEKIRAGDSKVNLNDYENFNFFGVSSSPLEGFENGVLKGTALNKAGKLVEVLLPMPEDLSAAIPLKIAESNTLLSGKSNEQILNEAVRSGGRSRYSPFPGTVTQKVKGEVFLYKLNKDGTLGEMLTGLEERRSQEHSEIGRYFSIFENTN